MPASEAVSPDLRHSTLSANAQTSRYAVPPFPQSFPMPVSLLISITDCHLGCSRAVVSMREPDCGEILRHLTAVNEVYLLYPVLVSRLLLRRISCNQCYGQAAACHWLSVPHLLLIPPSNTFSLNRTQGLLSFIEPIDIQQIEEGGLRGGKGTARCSGSRRVSFCRGCRWRVPPPLITLSGPRISGIWWGWFSCAFQAAAGSAVCFPQVFLSGLVTAYRGVLWQRKRTASVSVMAVCTPISRYDSSRVALNLKFLLSGIAWALPSR